MRIWIKLIIIITNLKLGSLKEEDKCNFMEKLQNDFWISEVNSIEILNKKITFDIEEKLTKTYKIKTDQRQIRKKNLGIMRI